MQQTRRGPQFERHEDQRVIIGAHEPRTRPTPTPAEPRANRKPSLLDRLRARFRGEQVREERGPDFRQPDGTTRIGKYSARRRDRSAGGPKGRPTGFDTTTD